MQRVSQKNGLVVPENQTRVGGHWGEFKVIADLEEWIGDCRWQALEKSVADIARYHLAYL